LLAHVAAGTADGLPEPTYSLTGRLPQLLAEAADPLPDPAERLPGAAHELAGCTAGPERPVRRHCLGRHLQQVGELRTQCEMRLQLLDVDRGAPSAAPLLRRL
jgi:hypothetical protein